MLGALELDTVIQVGSHESGVEGQNHLPPPAGHASLDAAQDMVGFLDCKRTLPAHVELLIHQREKKLLIHHLKDYYVIEMDTLSSPFASPACYRNVKG